MRNMMKEDEDGMLSKHQSHSQLTEDDYIESANGGVALKKGPWTAAEDAILVEYVKHHGEGNWNAVQKHSGLSRCGKSCRLRWANHLRPNLKKGAFTPEEEQLIIELHAKMGNKWARMAAHLPGRTDNEIKNYWNTRVKRRERAGLPLYPPEVSLQTFQETQEGLDVCGTNGDRGFHDLMYSNNYEMPGFFFESFGANHHLLGHEPELPDLPPITTHRHKRLRESANLLCSFDGGAKKEFSYLHQFEDETKDYLSQSFDLGLPFDPDLTSKNLPSLVESQEFPVFSECSFSAFMPTSRTGKLELPSLQYPETLLDSPEISSGPSVKKSEGTLMHSPLVEMAESDCTTPRNSGLLDALLYEARSLCNAKNNSSDRSSKSSTVDVAESSGLNICSTEPEEYSHPLSPLGHTASSISNCTPARASGSFSNEDPPGVTFTGYHVKHEPIDHASTMAAEETEDAALEFCRRDGLPVSNWLQPSSDFSKDQNIMIDAIGALLGDDLNNEYKQMASGAMVSSHQGRGIEFFANNLPAICQTSKPTP